METGSREFGLVVVVIIVLIGIIAIWNTGLKDNMTQWVNDKFNELANS